MTDQKKTPLDDDVPVKDVPILEEDDTPDEDDEEADDPSTEPDDADVPTSESPRLVKKKPTA